MRRNWQKPVSSLNPLAAGSSQPMNFCSTRKSSPLGLHETGGNGANIEPMLGMCVLTFSNQKGRAQTPSRGCARRIRPSETHSVWIRSFGQKCRDIWPSRTVPKMHACAPLGFCGNGAGLAQPSGTARYHDTNKKNKKTTPSCVSRLFSPLDRHVCVLR